MSVMTNAEIISLSGIAINLIALLIAVSRVLAASTAAEVRSAERFTRLETKTERVESDVQLLFRMSPKRETDHKGIG